MAALPTRQKSICKFCGSIGHKADACIIRGPKLLPPNLRRMMNKFNALYGDKTTDPPRDCNSQPSVAPFKSSTSHPKTSPVISSIMGRLNNNTIDNGGVNVPNSYFPVEYNSESVPYPDTTKIKSIDDDEMYHPL